VDLATLAKCDRRWSTLFSVEGEVGDKLLERFLTLAGDHSPLVIRLPTSISSSTEQQEILLPSLENSPGVQSDKRHYTVAVGGTFDHLHIGHKLLLTMTLFLLDSDENTQRVRRLIVGITGDELLKSKKYAAFLDSWDDRQRQVSDFIVSISRFSPRGVDDPIRIEDIRMPETHRKLVRTSIDTRFSLECFEIGDPFGPTIVDESITALVVSAETRGGGQAVNTKREEKSWTALDVYEVDVLDARDHGESQDSADLQQSFASKISSTELRRRETEKVQP
jgi:phosphopantetheine adenylyltransferase